MNTYVYFTKPTRPAMLVEGLNEHEMAAYLEHRKYLEGLTQEGKLIVAGRTMGESAMGIAIIKAESEEEARRMMNADPFMTRGVVTGALEGFSPL